MCFSSTSLPLHLKCVVIFLLSLGIILLVANRYLSFPPKLEENSRSYTSYPGNTYTWYVVPAQQSVACSWLINEHDMSATNPMLVCCLDTLAQLRSSPPFGMLRHGTITCLLAPDAVNRQQKNMDGRLYDFLAFSVRPSIDSVDDLGISIYVDDQVPLPRKAKSAINKWEAFLLRVTSKLMSTVKKI